MVYVNRLDNKLILVTGASSGIGRSVAQMLSELGARLVLVGREQVRLEETLASLHRPSVHYVEPYDMHQFGEIGVWLRSVIGRIGSPFDGYVHSAGQHKLTPLRTIGVSDLSLFDVNLYASLFLLKACCDRRITSDGASFVVVSSVSAMVGTPGLALYSASKGALHAVIKSAAMELANRRIRVNAVAAGMVTTPLTESYFAQVGEERSQLSVHEHPLGLGEPQDVAHAVSYLLSEGAKWVTGSVLTVDGGYSAH